jgi:hypothetical protein
MQDKKQSTFEHNLPDMKRRLFHALRGIQFIQAELKEFYVSFQSFRFKFSEGYFLQAEKNLQQAFLAVEQILPDFYKIEYKNASEKGFQFESEFEKIFKLNEIENNWTCKGCGTQNINSNKCSYCKVIPDLIYEGVGYRSGSYSDRTSRNLSKYIRHIQICSTCRERIKGDQNWIKQGGKIYHLGHQPED